MKTMKTLKSLMAAAIILCTANANAQTQKYYNTKNEVAITIGTGTNSQIFDAFSDLGRVMGSVLITGMATGGHYVGYTTYDDKSYLPPISVEYFHHLNKCVSIGAIAALNSHSSDMYCTWESNNGDRKQEKVGKATKNFVSFLPAAKFDWLRKKNFGMYSKIGAGFTYMHEKEVQNNQDEDKEVNSDNEFFFTFQASLIGIEVGSEKIRGFAELGVGEQGIALAGIRCKF